MHHEDTYQTTVCPYCGSKTEPVGTTPTLRTFMACASMSRETILDYQLSYLEAINLTDRFSRDEAIAELIKPSHIVYYCGDWQDGNLIKAAPFEWNDWQRLIKQMPNPWSGETVQRLSPAYYASDEVIPF